MDGKVNLHTRIRKPTYDKLKNVYGGGFLNAGIEKVVELAEGKVLTIKEGIAKVVDHILAGRN